MIDALPPTSPLPAYEVIGVCKRGSRDCFPKDRVGGFRQDTGFEPIHLSLTSVSELMTQITQGLHAQENPCGQTLVP